MRKPPMTAKELFAVLRPLQEKKGYSFNWDETVTLDLLEQLLVTRARYGYMACPCRFANGEYARDNDIVCPCIYREADVREFGACYCGLYLSRELNEKKMPCPVVPDRRPPDNILL